ncbi:trimeric intracellular cation channel family protein [Neisseria leonii]|uniref:trimeric intracellular cation channel family protein n=1 Tax=Neisseria leonii TaxID=2995413 RepID=UPI00237A8BD9|nr:trimeric intracellular cation channel family protein [Neisseria sp. 3986]MDD9326586.1 trimeric intracellular cation channel family protein [Neisseria sp. 3986]
MQTIALPPENLIIYTLDMVGIFACSAAATVLAKRLNLDIFGALLVSCVGAVGGGTLRDLLLDRHPIFWLHDLNYLYLICATSITVQIFYHWFEKLDRAMRWFDALGLAAFTVIGIEAALAQNMPLPVVLLMGIITAVAGGMMRDVFCRQLPLLLHKEIYITAALSGGIAYLLMRHAGISLWLRDVATLLLIFTVRMLAVYRGWNLPNITLPPGPRPDKSAN